MATFFGSDNADTITPEFVSGWISPSPAGSTPGDGTDYIFAADGHDSLDGGGGNDLITGGGGNDTIRGGAGADSLMGGDGNDIIYNDESVYLADRYHDEVYGGAGNDLIHAFGAGSYFGQENNDRFIVKPVTGAGQQLFHGGSGRDTLDFSTTHIFENIYLGSREVSTPNLNFSHIENVIGNYFDNRIFGDSEWNTLSGGLGDDTIFGGNGNDVIKGDEDDDYLRGQDGADTLYGGDGDDRLMGGIGNDRIFGNQGADILEGGSGADWFDFNRVEDSQGWDHDRIVGFDGAGSWGGDLIDVGGIDANTGVSGNQRFEFLGAVSDSQGLSHGAGHLWTVNTGGNTYVRGNVDGDRFLELTILIEDGAGTSASDYERSDFIL